MAYIERESAVAIIEQKQKELCPVGRYDRYYVYGSDRDTYDKWEEIIDALNVIPSVDVTPVVHARWNPYHESDFCWDEYGVICTNCNFKVENKDFTFPGKYCPNCGAKMDGETS